jgi:hypothetical protein
LFIDNCIHLIWSINAQEGEEANQQNTVITIELDNKKLSRSEGEPIFDQDGKPTQYIH